MSNARANLLLHPVRLRIVTAAAGRELTAADLAAALPDVPQATLYRRLKRLVDGGMLAVVAENPVRGLVQQVYTLAAPNISSLDAADIAGLSKDEQRALFAAFAVTLTASFEQHLARSSANTAAEDVGFHLYPLYLTDAELAQLGAGLAQLIGPLLANRPGAGRRRHLLATAMLPAAEP